LTDLSFARPTRRSFVWRFPRRSGWLAGACVMMAAWSLAGCGPSEPPGPKQLPTVPAAGTVTYNGQPLANATISCQSVDGEAAASGKSDASGKFALKSYGDKDGAPAGSYKVSVSVSAVQEIEPGVLAPEPPGGFKSPIPAKFGNVAESGLTLEVPAAGSTELKLDLR
jgi:hypothetical protein